MHFLDVAPLNYRIRWIDSRKKLRITEEENKTLLDVSLISRISRLSDNHFAAKCGTTKNFLIQNYFVKSIYWWIWLIDKVWFHRNLVKFCYFENISWNQFAYLHIGQDGKKANLININKLDLGNYKWKMSFQLGFYSFGNLVIRAK